MSSANLPRQREVLDGLRDVVTGNLSLLLPVEKAWQPTDFLPDLSAADWRDQLERFRAPAEQLSDDVLVVLVGNMVTEEALPNYSVSLNIIAQDHSGTSDEPWAQWLRGWTAEENRHGDLLNGSTIQLGSRQAGLRPIAARSTRHSIPVASRAARCTTRIHLDFCRLFECARRN